MIPLDNYLRVLLSPRQRRRAAAKALKGRSKPGAVVVATKRAMSTAERDAAGQQRLSMTAAGLTGLGLLGLPALTLAGLPLLAYSYGRMMRHIWRSYRSKGRIMVATLDALSLSFALAMGYFFTASLLLAVYFTAVRLVARTEREAHADFSRIFGELSDTVWLVKDGTEIEIPLSRLKAGDRIAVHAGEMVPVDGTVAAGEGMLDQHLLTGESQPVEKTVGDPVLTSTLVIAGSLQVVVEHTGEDSITGQIARTLEHAATFKHKMQSRGERLVEQGASITMLTSAAALPILGLSKAVALSYSGFGYQMRMAAPLMVLNYLRISSGKGILVKDGRALDLFATVDTVIFDKTGTLTEEVPRLGSIVATAGHDQAEVLRIAASAEQRQRHPIAQAICRHARQVGIALLPLRDTDYAVGRGLKVQLGDADRADVRRSILIGSRRFMESRGIDVPADIDVLQAAAAERGFSVVYVAEDGGLLIGALQLIPALRPDAKEAIDALHGLGLTTCIISGDQGGPTRYLADTLGVDRYFAETLPTAKAEHVRDLQQQGRKVCFIGDGINDSVALQQADVSVSLHGAATIAQDTADILLTTPDLMHMPQLVRMSRDLHWRMNASEVMNYGFGVACIGAVLVLGMGVGGAIVLYSGGLLTNLLNSMTPLFLQRRARPLPAPPATAGRLAGSDGVSRLSKSAVSLKQALPGLWMLSRCRDRCQGQH